MACISPCVPHAGDNECGWRSFAVGLVRALHAVANTAAAGPAFVAHMKQRLQRVDPQLLEVQAGWGHGKNAANGLAFLEVCYATAVKLGQDQLKVQAEVLVAAVHHKDHYWPQVI